MIVKIRIFRGLLSEIMGQSEDTVKIEHRAKIIEVLKLLADKYGKPFRDYVFDPKTNEVTPGLLFSLNGANISSLKGTETEIDDGSELLIMPGAGGG